MRQTTGVKMMIIRIEINQKEAIFLSNVAVAHGMDLPNFIFKVALDRANEYTASHYKNLLNYPIEQLEWKPR